MKNRWSSFSCLVLVTGVLAGCFSFETSYPEKRYFTLSTSRASPALESAAHPIRDPVGAVRLASPGVDAGPGAGQPRAQRSRGQGGAPHGLEPGIQPGPHRLGHVVHQSD